MAMSPPGDTAPPKNCDTPRLFARLIQPVVSDTVPPSVERNRSPNPPQTTRLESVGDTQMVLDHLSAFVRLQGFQLIPLFVDRQITSLISLRSGTSFPGETYMMWGLDGANVTSHRPRLSGILPGA